MDDLISRKALLKSFDLAWMVEYDETGCGVSKRAIPVATIEAAPAVEAVPVVRCRECKYFRRFSDGSPFIGTCELAKYYIGEKGYCVYGVMREDDAAEAISMDGGSGNEEE